MRGCRVTLRLKSNAVSLICSSVILSDVAFGAGITRIFGQAEIPLHRQHSPKDIDHIVQNVRRSERIDTDPMRCLETFYLHNPASVFQ